jgi:hypothetical protein
LKVHYAHGGGYTELGGMKSFLEKVNSKVKFERLFPAKKPKKKPSFLRIDRKKRRERESGVTGRKLFKELLHRLEKKKLDNEKVNVLVVIDDTDCKLSNETAREKFRSSVEDFKNKAKRIFEGLEVIFIWAEPEIEKWFCIDVANCFPNNKPCGDKDLHRKLVELAENYSYEYDAVKDSCKEKFSEKFANILEECKVLKGGKYSKREDGSLFLKKVNPFTLERKDKFSAEGIRKLKTLKYGGNHG